jgi:hypothetical protein
MLCCDISLRIQSEQQLYLPYHMGYRNETKTEFFEKHHTLILKIKKMFRILKRRLRNDSKSPLCIAL